MTMPLPFAPQVPVPTLRPYQTQALDAIQAAYEDAETAALLVLATGCGKTIVFSELIRRWDVPTLVLAHREELLTQARDKLRAVWPQADIGLIGAGYDEMGHHVTIASVASLVQAKRLAKFAARRLGLVVIDEAHHTQAPTYKRVLKGIGVGQPDGPFLLGVTATPQRSDGKSLAPIYGQPVFTAGLADMVRAGYLCDLQGIQIQTATRLDDVPLGRDGDFSEEALAAAVNQPDRNRIIVDAFERHASDRPTIVFAVDVQHAHDLAELFRARGVSAAALDGTTPRDERHRMLHDFAAGRIQVLCNMMVLTEGFDEPSVSCLILARPTQSRSLYVQMTGRGSRLAPGKKNCIIIDVADNTVRHSLTLMSLPKLVGREGYGAPASTEDRDGAGRLPKAPAAFSLREALDTDITTSPVIERNVALLADAFTWERQGAGNYRLRVASSEPRGSKALLQLVLRDEGYLAQVQWPDGDIQTLNPTPLSLDWAQTVAEDAALSIVRGNVNLVDRRAPWRGTPASDKQMGMLKRLGVALPKGRKVTKGEASDMISTAMAQQAKGKIA